MILHTVAECGLYIWKEMCWKQSLVVNFKIINNSPPKRKISTDLEEEIMLWVIYYLPASALKVQDPETSLISHLGFPPVLRQKYSETLAQTSRKWLRRQHFLKFYKCLYSLSENYTDFGSVWLCALTTSLSLNLIAYSQLTFKNVYCWTELK